MWLIDVKTLELHEFIGDNIPNYAILSHTWGPEEVSFVEMKKPKYREAARQKLGFSKIKGCCALAEKDELKWAWVDSCCIDKRSSAELSEAINSMFKWYKTSERCYVYLSDIQSGSDAIKMLEKSRWFTRGWTLQELLAPLTIDFFAQDWSPIGCIYNDKKIKYRDLYEMDHGSGLRMTTHGRGLKLTTHRRGLGLAFHSSVNLLNQVSLITLIPKEYLLGGRELNEACVAQRMFWASRRETTRAEDLAYCLMGLFDINMPVLYGEGLEKAFARLQHQIMGENTDQTIMTWGPKGRYPGCLLAGSPLSFQSSGTVQPLQGETLSSFSVTNLGLRITLPTTWLGVQEHEKRNKKAAGHPRYEAKLQCFENDKIESDRAISLVLRWASQDIENIPIFICIGRSAKGWNSSLRGFRVTSMFLKFGR